MSGRHLFLALMAVVIYLNGRRDGYTEGEAAGSLRATARAMDAFSMGLMRATTERARR